MSPDEAARLVYEREKAKEPQRAARQQEGFAMMAEARAELRRHFEEVSSGQA